MDSFTFHQLAIAASHMGDNAGVIGLVWVIIADITTGLVKAVGTKTPIMADSRVGLYGLCKHALVLLLALTLYPILTVLGMTMPANTLIFFFISFYGLSIVENLGLMGIPIPAFISEKLQKLKDSPDVITKKPEENNDENDTKK